MSYILVAEDDPHIQLLVRRKLEGAGYEVRTTIDGNDAVQMAFENRPRILLLDVMLPGCSGLEICEKVKTHFGDSAPPVIIMSARGQQSDVDAGEQAGADDYLIKPFAPKDLLAHIQKWIK